MGCWCPWSPNPDCLENQEYAETQLNTLMKEYKKNMNDKDVVFEARKTSLFPAQSVSEVSEAIEENAVDDNEIVLEEPVGTSADPDANPQDTIDMSDVKSSIEQVDAWSAQKLGIQ